MLTLYYNEYENQIKFHNVYKKLPQLATLPAGKMPASLTGYDVEPDGHDTLVNLQEYAVAASLYYAMLETVACETSQRVTAMDNASTNAKDMVDRFKLIYNRARQAKITTELTEIICAFISFIVCHPRLLTVLLCCSLLRSTSLTDSSPALSPFPSSSCCDLSSLQLVLSRCSPTLHPIKRVERRIVWDSELLSVPFPPCSAAFCVEP